MLTEYTFKFSASTQEDKRRCRNHGILLTRSTIEWDIKQLVYTVIKMNESKERDDNSPPTTAKSQSVKRGQPESQHRLETNEVGNADKELLTEKDQEEAVALIIGEGTETNIASEDVLDDSDV